MVSAVNRGVNVLPCYDCVCEGDVFIFEAADCAMYAPGASRK